VGFLLSTALAGGCGAGSSTNSNEPEEQCPRFVEDGRDTLPDPPDGPSLCPAANTCNYQSQEGCAADQACRPTLTASNTIIARCEMAGTRTAGESCTQWTDCAPGYVCPDNHCRKLCCGRDWSDSACDPGESCYSEWFLEVAGEPQPIGAFLCFPSGCDVFTSDECPSTHDCKIIDPKGTTACVPPSPETIGEPCGGSSVCGRGLSCVGPDGDRHCRRLCRAEPCGKPACGEDEGVCVHFNRDPDGVGECTPGF
jgi:hypothetical protein